MATKLASERLEKLGKRMAGICGFEFKIEQWGSLGPMVRIGPTGDGWVLWRPWTDTEQAEMVVKGMLAKGYTQLTQRTAPSPQTASYVKFKNTDTGVGGMAFAESGETMAMLICLAAENAVWDG